MKSTCWFKEEKKLEQMLHFFAYQMRKEYTKTEINLTYDIPRDSVCPDHGGFEPSWFQLIVVYPGVFEEASGSASSPTFG